MFQNKAHNSQHGNTVLLTSDPTLPSSFFSCYPNLLLQTTFQPHKGTVISVLYASVCLLYAISSASSETPILGGRPMSNTSFSVNAFRIFAHPPTIFFQNYELKGRQVVRRKSSVTVAGSCGFPCCPHVPSGNGGLATMFAQGQGSNSCSYFHSLSLIAQGSLQSSCFIHIFVK